MATRAYAATIPAAEYERRRAEAEEILPQLLFFSDAEYDRYRVAARTREELLALGARPEDIRPAWVYGPGEEVPEEAFWDEDGTAMVTE